MDRREFLWEATGAAVGLTTSGKIAASLVREPLDAPSPGDPTQSILVSTVGDDQNPGTISRPLKTFQAAQSAVRELKKHNPGTLSVYFRAGTYYLPNTIVFTPEDSGEAGAPIIYAPHPGEHVLLRDRVRDDPAVRLVELDAIVVAGATGCSAHQSPMAADGLRDAATSNAPSAFSAEVGPAM